MANRKLARTLRDDRILTQTSGVVVLNILFIIDVGTLGLGVVSDF